MATSGNISVRPCNQNRKWSILASTKTNSINSKSSIEIHEKCKQVGGTMKTQMTKNINVFMFWERLDQKFNYFGRYVKKIKRTVLSI